MNESPPRRSLSIAAPLLTNRSVEGKEDLRFSLSSVALFYPCPGKTECSPYSVDLPAGSYLVEVWGSQGGNFTSEGSLIQGCRGGYSRGVLRVEKQTALFVYIGSAGPEGGGDGGFNGGGAIASTQYLNQRAPGGGSTDIRTEFGSEVITRNSYSYKSQHFGPQSSLSSRIIVGGGGGGIAGAGFGGGLAGGNGDGATGGNQTHGGTSDEATSFGGFGYGGQSTVSYQGISGGGGGYYGGGGYTLAAGGSGFVDHTVLARGVTIGGNEVFPSPFGGEEQGHRGDGAARITILDFLPSAPECFVFGSLIYSFVLSITVTVADPSFL
jgi:hypothetical protein